MSCGQALSQAQSTAPQAGCSPYLLLLVHAAVGNHICSWIVCFPIGIDGYRGSLGLGIVLLLACPQPQGR